MGNIFIKAGGLESFTTIESATGRAKDEVSERTANQFVSDLVYRFGKSEQYWLGAKYNSVKSEMISGTTTYDAKIDRVAFSGGWFFTKNIMAKLEYVNQNYGDQFPANDYRKNGNFKGFVLEAVVSF